MASVIQVKYSSVTGTAPTTGDLTVEGEIAINTTDKLLYTRDSSNAIVVVGEQPGSSDGAVKVWDNDNSVWKEMSHLTINPDTGAISLNATTSMVISNLPTSDPINAGQLWNDSGTLKVSAG